ncbi:hypothetical protein ACFHPP_11330 [Falsiroseomonas sp. E2-1-a20]
MKERDEAKRPAIYFLSGEGEAGEVIYIGECDSLAERFRGKHHALEKADWRQITVASTTDETFNKAHARRAEHLLVEASRILRRALVLTDQTSLGKLSDGDAAFAQGFVDDVALLAEIIGVRVFRAPPNQAPMQRLDPAKAPRPALATPPSLDIAVGDTFRFVGARDINAQMRADGSGFIILAGSELRKSAPGATPPGIIALRNRALQSDLLESHPEKSELMRFKTDFPVGSTSAAAGVLTGTSLRGPHAWLHEAPGRRYDQWIEALQKVETPL